jgi:hypothetical protein
MTLLRKLFWLALFLAFTLGFVTLFDHGYVTNAKFTADAKSEVTDLIQLFHAATAQKPKSDDSTK